MEILLKLSQSNNRNQLKDKTNHNVTKTLQWIDLTVFKLLFLSCQQNPKDKTTKQKTHKRLPLCKDHSQCLNGSTETEE